MPLPWLGLGLGTSLGGKKVRGLRWPPIPCGFMFVWGQQSGHQLPVWLPMALLPLAVNAETSQPHQWLVSLCSR